MTKLCNIKDTHYYNNELFNAGSESESETSSDSSSNSESDDNNDNENIKQILGDDPNDERTYGPDVSEDLALRWNKYLSEGLDKETRTKLFEIWNAPSNCTMLQGPKLNPEVQTMLSPTEAKKETFLMELQNNLGKGLSALGAVITKLLEHNNPEEPDPNLKNLVESGKLLCNVHYTISNHRKFVLYPHLSKKIQKVAAAQNPDSLLFGEDFSEKCKAAKSLETTASELKAPSTSKNFKGPASKTRWKPPGKQQGGGSSSKAGYRTSYRTNHRKRDKQDSYNYRKGDTKNKKRWNNNY